MLRVRLAPKLKKVIGPKASSILQYTDATLACVATLFYQVKWDLSHWYTQLGRS